MDEEKSQEDAAALAPTPASIVRNLTIVPTRERLKKTSRIRSEIETSMETHQAKFITVAGDIGYVSVASVSVEE
uniref:Uncharacterized protein n=1 Tax=Hyaloperonospora arabidopsidis (strain Emoy2) TaxID=559515 RepID=M4BMI9_HYAAE